MTQRPTEARSSVGLWLLASLLVLGSIAAGLSFASERREANDRDTRAVDIAASQLSSVIEKTIGSLRGADGLVVDGEMSKAEFDAFADNVLQESLFPRLAYVTVLTDAEIPAFEATRDVAVRDTDGKGGFTPTAPRAEHLVLQYVYPLDEIAQGILGFDIASDATRAATASASAASGSPALGHIGSLATNTRPGLFGAQVVRRPDGSVVGYVSGGVNVDEILAVAARGAGQETAVSVYLGGELVAGTARGGARQEFRVGGLEFVVEANDADGTHLTLPWLIVVATALLAPRPSAANRARASRRPQPRDRGARSAPRSSCATRQHRRRGARQRGRHPGCGPDHRRSSDGRRRGVRPRAPTGEQLRR